jgi:hypothetical protein
VVDGRFWQKLAFFDLKSDKMHQKTSKNCLFYASFESKPLKNSHFTSTFFDCFQVKSHIA